MSQVRCPGSGESARGALRQRRGCGDQLVSVSTWRNGIKLSGPVAKEKEEEGEEEEGVEATVAPEKSS